MAEYRRFIAPTLEEAKREMIKEMGTKAYIVKTNKIVKKSFWGFKKDHFVEIQAGKLTKRFLGFENKSQHSLINKDKNLSFLEEVVRNQKPTTSPKSINGFSREQSLENAKRLIAQKYLSQPPPIASLPSRQKQVHTIKQQYDASNDQFQNSSVDEITNNVVANFLKEWEFEKSFIEIISKDYTGELPSSQDGKIELADFVASHFKYAGKIKNYASSPNIILFLGATGIGKTTTLAKVVAQQRFMTMTNKKKCVLATFDVIRIMATAQLEKYANIMEIPFRVLRSKMDLKKLISDFIDYDLVFIDTAGTSHHDVSYLKEMEEFVAYIDIPKEVYFCLNASLRQKEMMKILNHFEAIPFDRIIITKVDESDTMGPILSAVYKKKLDISYITNGQQVPEDVFLGTKETVKKQLLKEWT